MKRAAKDVSPDNLAEARFIILRDESSSMSWFPNFPQVWNEQIVELAKLISKATVSVYTVSRKVRKIHDHLPLSELEPIDAKTWYFGDGGALQGGTALGDALIRACHKAQRHRASGCTGPLGIFLLTDGWSKDDRLPHEMARDWLRYVRDELDVTFRMISFVNPQTKAHLLEFYPGRVRRESFNQENVTRKVHFGT